MDSSEIRTRFLEFFREQGHAVVPSSSLIPDDPSVLLTTAGMQQFKKYYTGEADPMRDFGSRNTASAQKSFRTSDIDEVGDERHLTFFEMLGNFSFGGYGKTEAIRFAYEFITDAMGLKISYVTIFQGSSTVPQDEESRAIWQALGVADIREEGMNDVFWGPTGSSGPCGPTTEIYCKNAAGQDIEIWNIVFNQFFYPGSREELLAGTPDKELQPLATFGVDTGMGLERLAMASQKTNTIFETDLFAPLLALLPRELDERKRRIIGDHTRAATFLIADGVRPSNRAAGYILRRLMRRVFALERLAAIPPHVIGAVVHEVIHDYGDAYPELKREGETIRREFDAEREKFLKTLDAGMKEFGRLPAVGATEAFTLYQSYGMPFEVIKELDPQKTAALTRDAFDREFTKHQEISRAGAEKKFGGHGLVLDTGELKAKDEAELEKVTRLHTATHLLHQALRTVLGDSVHQMGSDITAERTRFDFAFDRKLTPDELKSVEELVNQQVARDLPVTKAELPIEEAKKTGALYFFKEKYPEQVNVYSVGDFSKEFCGGPHVTHTGQIGHVRIVKEEASSAGVRRIRAIVEG
ncbi:alanine--tRNA ligase [Candidatus Parcubacteria bacterium]|nr:MAG: alanine--tRNA ligase [Candidatus Parcubacteria bacterium]